MLFDPAARDAWIRRVNADREFQLVSRWNALHFQLGCDGVAHPFSIAEGKLGQATAPAGVELVSLEGSQAAWAAFLEPMPASPNHHVLGMDRRRDDFSIAQGRHLFIRHLRVMTTALNLMRIEARA
jgi:hypothetical protein